MKKVLHRLVPQRRPTAGRQAGSEVGDPFDSTLVLRSTEFPNSWLRALSCDCRRKVGLQTNMTNASHLDEEGEPKADSDVAQILLVSSDSTLDLSRKHIGRW
jgi:hypothetical protein